jgi:RHS repeat-associated protein
MKFSEIANRLTGISTPFGGASWQPAELEIAGVRRVIAFLEDRRVLYDPCEMEVPDHCVRSVIEIRHCLTEELGKLEGNGGSTQFEHQNWLGTERLRTSYNGAVVISIASLPWGDGHEPSGDNGDQHDFAQMDRDLEDNTEHAQYRQYSTNLGRWQSPDPYLGSYDFTNPQSFNRYTYALNDPVNFLDPSGLDPVCTTDPETGTVTCTSSYPSCDTSPYASGCNICVQNPLQCYGGGSGGTGGQLCAWYGLCDIPPNPNNPGGSNNTPNNDPAHLARLSAPNNAPTPPQPDQVQKCARSLAVEFSCPSLAVRRDWGFR